MTVNSNPVTWDDPTVVDAIDTSPTVECNPASNSDFTQGRKTPVICTATDAAGNRKFCVFNVTLG